MYIRNSALIALISFTSVVFSMHKIVLDDVPPASPTKMILKPKDTLSVELGQMFDALSSGRFQEVDKALQKTPRLIFCCRERKGTTSTVLERFVRLHVEKPTEAKSEYFARWLKHVPGDNALIADISKAVEEVPSLKAILDKYREEYKTKSAKPGFLRGLWHTIWSNDEEESESAGDALHREVRSGFISAALVHSPSDVDWDRRDSAPSTPAASQTKDTINSPGGNGHGNYGNSPFKVAEHEASQPMVSADPETLARKKEQKVLLAELRKDETVKSESTVPASTAIVSFAPVALQPTATAASPVAVDTKSASSTSATPDAVQSVDAKTAARRARIAELAARNSKLTATPAAAPVLAASALVVESKQPVAPTTAMAPTTPAAAQAPLTDVAARQERLARLAAANQVAASTVTEKKKEAEATPATPAAAQTPTNVAAVDAVAARKARLAKLAELNSLRTTSQAATPQTETAEAKAERLKREQAAAQLEAAQLAQRIAQAQAALDHPKP